MSKRVFIAPENPYYDFDNVVACFSQIKRLRSYNGNLIQARQGSNTQDIAPLGDYLNQGSLFPVMTTNPLGALAVPIWYNQVGLNNATQTVAANQPRIINGGVIDKVGPYPVLKFDGLDDTFTANGLLSTLGGNQQQMTLHFVFKWDGTLSELIRLGSPSTNFSYLRVAIFSTAQITPNTIEVSRRYRTSPTVQDQIIAPPNLITTTKIHLVTIDISSTQCRIYIDGILAVTQTLQNVNYTESLDRVNIGSSTIGSNFFNGDYLEFIGHNTSQFSAGTITAEMNNIKKLYGIP